MDNPFAPELLIDEAPHGVRIVTLNRPEAFNSANQRLHAHLAAVWQHLAEDREARAVVLTGAGKAFSAGGDMEHLAATQADLELRRREIDGARRLVHGMVQFELPVIAAVNGPAVGLGCSLAALSDVVLMAEGSYLADPHVSVGLTAADGGALAWPALISLVRAKEYLLTGDRIPAADAVALGLANRVVPADQLMEDALALATRMAKQPTQALRSTKKALNLHLAHAINIVIDYAFSEEFATFDSPEHKAIIAKMLDRPAPTDETERSR